jgi:hypothetical protein
VSLDALPEGRYRNLTEKELDILKKSTGRRNRG